MGITEDDFWDMNPHRFELHIKAYKKKIRQDLQMSDQLLHRLGEYVIPAVNAGVSGKTNVYPKKPFGIDMGEEEDNNIAVKDFFRQQDEMRRKWKANKGRA